MINFPPYPPAQPLHRPPSGSFFPAQFPSQPLPPHPYQQSQLPLPLAAHQQQFFQQLQSQIGSGRIYLNDMYFGDDGALRLAKEMKQINCSSIQVIEIRGNNISANGFEALFSVFLEQMEALKAISVEWNQLGSNPKGLQALEELIEKKESITFVDLRNNKIGGPEQCEIIARIIRTGKNLKTLDLR